MNISYEKQLQKKKKNMTRNLQTVIENSYIANVT